MHGFCGGGQMDVLQVQCPDGAADERKIAVRAPLGLGAGIGNQWTVGIVCKVKAASAVETFEGGVRVHPESGNQNGTVHHQLERAQFRRTIEDRLDERGFVRAAAFEDIAVQLRPCLAGNHDAGLRGGRG